MLRSSVQHSFPGCGHQPGPSILVGLALRAPATEDSDHLDAHPGRDVDPVLHELNLALGLGACLEEVVADADVADVQTPLEAQQPDTLQIFIVVRR
jgi:hypothetical protein